MEFRLGVCEEVLIKVGGMEDVLPDVPAWRERYASVIAAIKVRHAAWWQAEREGLNGAACFTSQPLAG